MNIRKLGRRVRRQYGGDITDMLGGNLRGISFQYGNLDGSAAEANFDARTITLDRGELKGLSRRALKGTLIHELAHLAGKPREYDASLPWGERPEEIRADAVRFALTGNAGITKDEHWREAQRLARKKGWTDMAGPQLPGLGKTGGRMRNTLANLMSHTTGKVTKAGNAATPQLSPEATAAYYAQMQGLYQQYELQRAQLKQQRVGLRAGLREQVTAIQAEKVGALAGVENEAIERGVLGSSAELTNRAGVRAEAMGAIAGAKRDMRLGLADTRLQDQQAAIGLYQGLSQLEADKAAQQQSLLAQQLTNNLIISGQESTLDVLKAMYRRSLAQGQGGGGAGGNGGASGTMGNFDSMKAIMRRTGLTREEILALAADPSPGGYGR